MGSGCSTRRGWLIQVAACKYWLHPHPGVPRSPSLSHSHGLTGTKTGTRLRMALCTPPLHTWPHKELGPAHTCLETTATLHAHVCCTTLGRLARAPSWGHAAGHAISGQRHMCRSHGRCQARLSTRREVVLQGSARCPSSAPQVAWSPRLDVPLIPWPCFYLEVMGLEARAPLCRGGALLWSCTPGQSGSPFLAPQRGGRRGWQGSL